MGSFSMLANAVNLGVGGIADWLHGCEHRRTTFPMTLHTRANVDGRHSMQPETYIVCLACGRHFAYDWTAMRRTRQRASGVFRLRTTGEAHGE